MTTAIPEVSIHDVTALAERAKSDAITFVEDNRVEVVDHASLERAAGVRRQIGEKLKGITATLAQPKAWAYGVHRWFCSLEAAAKAPYEILDKYEAESIKHYNDAQTRARETRERELADRRRRDEQARVIQEAATLERQGHGALASALVEDALTAPAPVVVLVDEVRAVVKFRRTWHHEVTDAELVPREFLTPDDSKLRKHATNMQGTAHVPGVRFYYVDEPIR